MCKPNFCHTLQNQPILTITLLIPIHHRLTRACQKICNKMHHWTPRLTILRQRCGLSRKRRERSWRAHSARCATKISSSGASLLTRARGCDQQKNQPYNLSPAKTLSINAFNSPSCSSLSDCPAFARFRLTRSIRYGLANSQSSSLGSSVPSR